MAGPPPALPRPRSPVRGRGLGGKLRLLLLAFGIIPLTAVILVGYRFSRALVLDQARHSLRSLVGAQALHIGTELARQRLLLRTIGGQLPSAERLFATSPDAIASSLVGGLPAEGVFDGLRLAGTGGRLISQVALRESAPQWPSQVPAADWGRKSLVVHRGEGHVLAYLLAVPISEAESPVWLEGHVREEDFSRIFSTPEHLFPGVETVVLDRSGSPVFAPPGHPVATLLALATDLDLSRDTTVERGEPRRFLTVVAPVASAEWTVVAALPTAVALAPLARLRNAAIAGAGLLAFLIMLTAAIASRRVTMPLRELRVAVERFGRDGRGAPITVRSADEIGTVVQSFNTMAESLEQSRGELEALHARDLERAQQLATVGELASGVAHEIRNPLTGVHGALDLALGKLARDDPSRGLLEEARRQLTRIDQTTTQLLRYARPPELHVVSVDANLLVARAATIVEPQASAADVALTLETSEHPIRVQVDPELMIQVLVNLMLNGLEATPPGRGVVVWVSQHAPHAWIGVRDSGAGILPEAVKDIFRPFFTTKPKGTGLGLPISRQIVERHGGTLRVEDTPGGGATFVVSLPLEEP